MQIKINGEQPFQVLGTNFTIGPSSSGYDLMFSADGLSYSKLFTVGANTNRQVTQVAAGSYYFLSGNTDSGVTVNWMKDCGGGGGGGSYVLPTASSDTLGGVKIGSGITIDANGVISSEGGGNSNYVIVDSLSGITDPYEGLDVYVKAKTEEVEYSGWVIDAANVNEDYCAYIYPDGQTEIAVYHNGEGFHWGWDNSLNGELKEFGEWYYTINEDHTEFHCFFNNENAYVNAVNGSTTATTSTTITVTTEAAEYRYNGSSWEPLNNIEIFYLNEMSQAQLANLYGEIKNYTENTFPAGRYHFYQYNDSNDEYVGKYEVYVARYDGQNINFSGLMQSRYSAKLLMRAFSLDYEGNLSEVFSENIEIVTPYEAFYEPGYDTAESFTGVSHDGWANIWEKSKSEGFDTFSDKEIKIKLFEGDTIPFKFHLVKASGTPEDESTMVLYFSGMQADYDTNTITVHKFSLYKDVNNDTYVPSALSASTYAATS